MIELIVAVGILAILFAIVLVAINPLEMINKSQDVATNAVNKDFASATKYFYATEKTTPWLKSSTCRDELTTKDKLSDMPACAQELTKGGDLQSKVINSDEAKNIFMTECGGSAALCYKPKSSTYQNDPLAKYGRNGSLKAECPGGGDCYVCDFTTNKAEECFKTMNPNAEIAIVPSGVQSQPVPVIERPSESVCDTQQDGKASCLADVVTDSDGNPLSTLAVPGGLSPEQIHKAYNLPCTPGGEVNSKCATPATYGPQTIAIVVAYHSPTTEQDLATYSTTYGLPPCSIANGCLRIVNQNGQTSPTPSTDSLWALESAMDVQIAHAVCQTCKILLVEATTNLFLDLGIATKRAGLMGATAISNSYGNYEFNGSTAYDQYYDQPGIAVVAASGDWGYGAVYPAASKKVIAVGGTALTLFPDNTYASETVWNGAGSGCSAYQSAVTHQTSLSNWSQMGCGTKKGISDVAAVASPNTGAAVFNSTQYGGTWGWWILGGTSLSSPLYAATVALQGGIPPGSDGSAFPYAHKDKLRDINIGSNGSCGGSSRCTAVVGYDGPTGLGTPNLIPPSEVVPTILPTSTPTSTPTLTPTPPGPDAMSGYIVNTVARSYTKVTKYTLTGQTPVINCDLGETTTCSQIPAVSGTDIVGQCTTTTSGYAVFSKVSCPGTTPTITPTPTLTPTTEPTPTLTPTVTPTPLPPISCGTMQTVTLTQTQPILALPGDTVLNTLTVKNNDSPNCESLLYTVSYGYPSGWILGGVPPSFTLTGGATKTINLSLQVPANATAGNYGYQLWVAKPGQTSPTPVNGSVQVAQVGPTNTPTPTPINCFQGWSNSLGSTSLSGNAGDTINQSITITYNNPPSCGGMATFAISHSYPSGWIINNLPASVQLAPGQSTTIPFTITISTGAQVQDYGFQYWINSGGLPMNATVHVLAAAPPPEEQMFSNFNAKMYGSYALFEYSYNATGNVSGRLDVSTDPNGLNTTTTPPAGTRFGFAFNSGNAMDASNQANPSSIRGFINSSPQYWTGWQCGATIYYRMYNSGDLRIKSPVKSAVVDCTTAIDVLPWSPWYSAIYQGVYDARYDADNNGTINYTDYWTLVRATRLR